MASSVFLAASIMSWGRLARCFIGQADQSRLLEVMILILQKYTRQLSREAFT